MKLCELPKWWQRQPCKFEPRYDESEPIIPAGVFAEVFPADELAVFRRKTYVCDVCMTCGHMAQRGS